MDPQALKEYIGLTSAQATVILAEEGPNELPVAGRGGRLRAMYEVVTEPMFLLLARCGVIYVFIGDIIEALMLLGFVFLVTGITLYQKGKTDRALDALRDLAAPRAMVLRDGKRMRIPGREVVRGDMVVISEGDRVPAEALLVKASILYVDESLLTGESLPVGKVAGDGNRPMQPGGEDLPFVFSGTLVVRGSGIARVVATGVQSAMGTVGRNLQPELDLVAADMELDGGSSHPAEAGIEEYGEPDELQQEEGRRVPK